VRKSKAWENLLMLTRVDDRVDGVRMSWMCSQDFDPKKSYYELCSSHFREAQATDILNRFPTPLRLQKKMRHRKLNEQRCTYLEAESCRIKRILVTQATIRVRYGGLYSWCSSRCLLLSTELATSSSRWISQPQKVSHQLCRILRA
jgi:hypothetical protein